VSDSVPAGSVPPPRIDPVNNLGSRVRTERLRSGMSLREVARRLGVSPSFVSQLENGKSQPSVATLYALSQLLNLSIDDLFSPEQTDVAVADGARMQDVLTKRLSRTDFGSPGEAWPVEEDTPRFVLVEPETRPRLVMDSGVIWEQLATNGDGNLDFMEIVYPPGSSSTTDSRMLRHQGMEYGYLLSGELEITYGFDSHTLRAGESMALDSTVPHLFTNRGTTPARGIWAVHHCGREQPREG
jgi:transcriptional regulator with XRE-family HTH domain